ncbi:MAG: transposase [Thermoanaerobaculia bacterium]|nr:transposase [Thermoanaerobaculia bacterium]
MPRKPRHLPRPGCLVEVTVRTAHSRYLLRPSGALNRVFAGCLGRAHELHPVRLHAVVVMSTHFHLLLSPENSQQLASFMGHLNGNLSKKIGRLHDWSGSMFERRYQCIPVSDEPAAQQARLRYLLQHGCKEGLVLSPRDWPGIHSAAALCHGEAIRGTWIHRTEYGGLGTAASTSCRASSARTTRSNSSRCRVGGTELGSRKGSHCRRRHLGPRAGVFGDPEAEPTTPCLRNVD